MSVLARHRSNAVKNAFIFSTSLRSSLLVVANTAVPLASTLLEISEKQNDPMKMLRSHQVLCEVAQMGVWSVGDK